MDIKVLKYFLAVAREGSITRAAECLHMTQPPLSRQMKDLEEETGVQLFKRASKRLTLTPEGLLLRKRAEEMVELFEKTKLELNQYGDNPSGDVYIGGGESMSSSLIAEAARCLQEKYPLIKYHLLSGDAEYITENLDKGLIDFGLLVEPMDITKYDYVRLPLKDTWGVLMRRDSPLSLKEAVVPEDLFDKPLLFSRQTAQSSEMSAWFGRDVSKLKVVAKYDLIYNASRFVREGFGYAVALDGIIDTSEESGLCFRPLRPVMHAGLCIAWKKHQIFSRAADMFLKQLYNEIDRYNSKSNIGDSYN